MTPAEESAIAWEIRAAEAEARSALAAAAALDPEIDRLLRRVGRRGATRAAAVEGLEAAVALALARTRPGASDASRALQRAVELRWRLVSSALGVASGEAWKTRAFGELDDLRQEAAVGVYRAAIRYDPALGIRFSAYARWWARAGITRSIDKVGRTVRLPSSLIEHRRNLLKLRRQAERLGVELTDREAAERLGIPADRVAELAPTLSDTVSLDAPDPRASVAEGDARTLADRVAAQDVEVSDRIGALQDHERLIVALERLTGRDHEVIVRHFGIGQERETLVQIGKSWGTTKEWVRRWKDRSLLLLRDALQRTET